MAVLEAARFEITFDEPLEVTFASPALGKIRKRFPKAIPQDVGIHQSHWETPLPSYEKIRRGLAPGTMCSWEHGLFGGYGGARYEAKYDGYHERPCQPPTGVHTCHPDSPLARPFDKKTHDKIVVLHGKAN